MSANVLHKFRLFVAEDAPNSAQAVANLNEFSRKYLPGQHEIEVVDVCSEPRRALAEGIMMTPTLIRLSPLPVRRIVGTLSQTQVLFDTFGIESHPA